MKLLPKLHTFESVAQELQEGFRDGTIVPRFAIPPLTTEAGAAAFAEAFTKLGEVFARLADLGLPAVAQTPPSPTVDTWISLERRQPGSTAGLLEKCLDLLADATELERTVQRIRVKQAAWRWVRGGVVLLGFVGANLGVWLLLPGSIVPFVAGQVIAFLGGWYVPRFLLARSAPTTHDWFASTRAALASLSDGFAKLGLPHG